MYTMYLMYAVILKVAHEFKHLLTTSDFEAALFQRVCCEDKEKSQQLSLGQGFFCENLCEIKSLNLFLYLLTTKVLIDFSDARP